MSRWAALRRKAVSLLRYPLFVQAWFLPLWVLLGIGKALIFTISFRRLAPWLGHSAGVSAWVPLLAPAEEARARLVGRAVRMTAVYTPWTSNCFPQALAARCLLGLYGVPHALYFGVRRGPGGAMEAHAWVAAGRVRVTGGEGFGQFTVVGTYTGGGAADGQAVVPP